ncbi:MAG: hypothetical protein ACYDAY_09240 [Candidatus Dormibacteria bacterium]
MSHILGPTAALLAAQLIGAGCISGTANPVAGATPTVAPGCPSHAPVLAVLTSSAQVRGLRGTYLLTPSFGVHNGVALVGADGKVEFKIDFQPQSAPVLNLEGTPRLDEEAATANGALYVMDGVEGKVTRICPASGDSGPVGGVRLPPSQREASFAVSPDGRTLAESVLAFGPPTGSPAPGAQPAPVSGPHTALYVYGVGDIPANPGFQEDASMAPPLSGHSHRLVSWDPGGPVAAVDPYMVMEDCCYGHSWYAHVVNLDSHGRPGAAIGGTDCLAFGESADGSMILCRVTSGPEQPVAMQVRTRGGTVAWTLPADLARAQAYSLSPDGARVAVYVPPPASSSVPGEFVVVERSGGRQEKASPLVPEGWFDDNTVVAGTLVPQTIGGTLNMVTVGIGLTARDLGIEGVYVGAIR